MARAARRFLPLAVLAAVLLFAGCGGDSGSTTASRPFQPQATLRAIGGTVRTQKPKLVIGVKARPGDENIRSVLVNLPPVLLVDPASLAGVCGQSQLEANGCKGKRKVGDARVVSPAYPGALSGPVYPVSGGDGSTGLPRLVYLLGGPAEVVLEGRVVSKGGRIQAGVEDVPDTPLETFELAIDGGKPGYLILSRDICSAEAVADATFTSQGDRTYREKVPLVGECGSG
jgi:hypothetical protein